MADRITGTTDSPLRMPPTAVVTSGATVAKKDAPADATPARATPANSDTVVTDRNAAAPRAVATPTSTPERPVVSARTTTPQTDAQALTARAAELNAKLEHSATVIADPRNQIPDLKPGQGLVFSDGPNNSRSLSVITSIEGDTIQLRNVNPYIGEPATRTTTRDELARDLLDPKKHITVREGQGIDSPRVPSIAERELTAARGVQQELITVGLQQQLGPRNFRIFTELAQRRGELSQMRDGVRGELKGWLENHSGFTSMSRLAVAGASALVDNKSWSQFTSDVGNAELLETAPQRPRLQSLDASIGEVDRAMVALQDHGKIDFTPTLDGVTYGLARFSQQGTGNAPQLTDRMTTSVGLMQGAIDNKQTDDGWAAYTATVQPYLYMPAATNGSFHKLPDGKASITVGINALIAKGTIGNRALVTTADDLVRLRGAIASHWTEAVHQQWTADGPSMFDQNRRIPFDGPAFDREVARLRAIERDPSHTAIAGYVQAANAKVPALVATEPGWVSRTAHTAREVLDSPKTWAMVAAVALTSGAGAAVLGAEATSAAELLTLARTTGMSVRGLAVLARGGAAFATQTAIDGALVHTATEAFGGIIGMPPDFSPQAYLQTIGMMGVSELASAAHVARAARQSPGIARALGEQARYLTEESAGLAAMTYAVSAGKADIGQSVQDNAQMMIAMRLLHAAKPATRRTTTPPRTPADPIRRPTVRTETPVTARAETPVVPRTTVRTETPPADTRTTEPARKPATERPVDEAPRTTEARPVVDTTPPPLREVPLSDVPLGQRVNMGGNSNVYAVEGHPDRLAIINAAVDPRDAARSQLSKLTPEKRAEYANAIREDVGYTARVSNLTFEGQPIAPRIYETLRDADGHTVGYVTERVQGRELQDLASHGQLTPAQLNEVERQLRGQIEVAHRAGLVHGDPHTGNVLVSTEPNVRARFIDWTPPGSSWTVADDAALFNSNTIGRMREASTPEAVARTQAYDAQQAQQAAARRLEADFDKVRPALDSGTRDFSRSLGRLESAAETAGKPELQAYAENLRESVFALRPREARLWKPETAQSVAAKLDELAPERRLRELVPDGSDPALLTARDNALETIGSLRRTINPDAELPVPSLSTPRVVTPTPTSQRTGLSLNDIEARASAPITPKEIPGGAGGAMSSGQQQVRVLRTDTLNPAELPYPSELRAPTTEPIRLADRIEDVPTADVKRISDVVPASGEHSGSAGFVRFAELADGRPVVVKTYYIAGRANTPEHVASSTLMEARSAQLMDQLGIGPKFHGIVRDGDRFGVVMDVVPGDFNGPVNARTLQDTETILQRVQGAGIETLGDFQVFRTPEGRIVAIDPGALSLYRNRTPNEWDSPPNSSDGDFTRFRMSQIANAQPADVRNYLNSLRQTNPEAEAGLREMIGRWAQSQNPHQRAVYNAIRGAL